MIKGISVHTDEAGFEQMFIFGKESSEADTFTCNLYREELTDPQKAVYDAAISVVASKYYNEIINTTSELEIDRITSTTLSDGTDVLDFNSLSETDKDKLRDFLALIVELKN